MNIQKLSSLAHCAKARTITSLFNQKERTDDFSLSTDNLHLDYSKQNINDVELEQLIKIAQEVGLSESISG
ncbi:MAG: glucose-6-phosphate isomerase, partial [Colwellia sp.]